MNKLSTARRAQVLASLVEGNSIRATCRMTGTAKGTVLRLLRDIGEACGRFHDEVAQDLPCARIQCDEIWSFCYAKQKNVPEEMRGRFGVGDVWTWVGIDPESKFVASWFVGGRDAGSAMEFMEDLAPRLGNRIQLTTDGRRVYVDAVQSNFGSNVDYAMLVKLYGPSPEPETRYSPARCNGIMAQAIIGNPDPAHVCTSHVERQNLTMRMQIRRFTRLTNAFSKKVENLEAAVNLHFVFYNFVRVHQTLGTTPAVALGIADRVWKLEDIIQLLDSK